MQAYVKYFIDNNNEKWCIYNDNNINSDKKAIEMKLSFCDFTTQYNYKLIIIKLELFGNILLDSNINDFKYHQKLFIK